MSNDVFLHFSHLGEELGWRGFLLPRLAARQGPLRASLVVGLLWGLWHLPAFWLPGTGKVGSPAMGSWE